MANYTVGEVVEQIQAKVATIANIQSAPTYPPDKMSVFPFAIAYPESGSIDGEFGSGTKGLHNIVIEVHLSRKMMSTTAESAIAFVDSVPDKMWGSIFDSTFTRFSTFQKITYQFVAMEWGGIETLGIRFLLEGVKVHKNL